MSDESLNLRVREASVADLRNHFHQISSWLEEGESVEILKRGKPFARLIPAGTPSRPAKADFRAQLSAAWGARRFSQAEMQAMREAERQGEEG